MLSTLICFLVGLFLLVAPAAIRRWFRRRSKARETATRCRCGYQMDQLDTIRCPECGRVSGFDATAEDMGLTPEQLLRAKARRDARQRDDDPEPAE